VADTPSAFSTSVTMRHTASRSLVAERRIVTLASSTVWVCQSVAKAGYSHCQVIGLRLAFRIVLVKPFTVDRPCTVVATGHYITPYFVTWPPVVRASLGGRHGFAPAGYKNGVMQSPCATAGTSAAGAPRSVPALRARACRPGGVLAPGYWSVALQVFLVSGFA